MLLPECLFGVPGTQNKAQISPADSPKASCQSPAWRTHGQKPGATPRGRTDSYFAHTAHRSKVGVEWGRGLSTNGQLVTKPTSFLKLGHRREMGAAELSPNRTVAHLVPGPPGTPGGGGGGEGRWPLPRLQREI